jgi:hypothetical protein
MTAIKLGATMDWSALIWAGVGAAVPILARILFVALVRDFARRFALTIVGVKLWDFVTSWALKDPIWSGRWRVTWTTNSTNFHANNAWTGRVRRCFDTMVAEGIGQTSTGRSVRYGFVGKLSRDRTILTGTWFDMRGATVGYHGCYQVRLFSAHDRAEGKWLGFSETSGAINTDVLKWERLSES